MADTQFANIGQIIMSCSIYIAEGRKYSDWDNGSYGHDITLFMPLDTLATIGVKEQERICQKILDDLRILSPSVDGEFINSLNFEVVNESDPEFQAAKSLGDPFPAPEANQDIWNQDMIRVFISHRDEDKSVANQIAAELEGFGFSCFVAHDTIEPMKEWKKEIVNGLQSMEVLLALVTDNFEKSLWTNQEIGYAVATGKPVVCLKFEAADPPGFISHIQAVKGSLSKPLDAPHSSVPFLAKAVDPKRMQASLIRSFVNSPDWGETTIRFRRLDRAATDLSDEDVEIIIEGFYRNPQLHNAGYLVPKNHLRLKDFLRRTTNKEFEVEGRTIKPLTSDDVPPF